MQTVCNSTLPRNLLIAILVGLAACIISAGIALRNSSQTAGISPSPTKDMAHVPPPYGTTRPIITVTVDGETPTQMTPSSTPTHVTLQVATLVTPTMVSEVTMYTDTLLSSEKAVNSAEPLAALAFTPAGDKLLYVTLSGKLYWSNLDGSNATLLQTYTETYGDPLLNEQRPLSNTLFIRHRETPPTRDHMDMIKFTPGKPPTSQEIYQPGILFDIDWWRTDRVSGTQVGSYFGGDRLVPLDTNGGLLSSLNVPFMGSGAVQSGGTWLAYATSQQSTDTPFGGSARQTIYLLNLSTGQRLQLTQPGTGWKVFSWSPDGNWIYASALVGNALRGVLISADGLQQIHVAPPGNSGYDAVWSPDSKWLAFSVQGGGCDDPGRPCPPMTSQVYLLNVAERRMSLVKNATASTSAGTEQMMMRPKWSPDGSRLALLSFDPGCASYSCAGTTPAFYIFHMP